MLPATAPGSQQPPEVIDTSQLENLRKIIENADQATILQIMGPLRSNVFANIQNEILQNFVSLPPSQGSPAPCDGTPQVVLSRSSTPQSYRPQPFVALQNVSGRQTPTDAIVQPRRPASVITANVASPLTINTSFVANGSVSCSATPSTSQREEAPPREEIALPPGFEAFLPGPSTSGELLIDPTELLGLPASEDATQLANDIIAAYTVFQQAEMARQAISEQITNLQPEKKKTMDELEAIENKKKLKDQSIELMEKRLENLQKEKSEADQSDEEDSDEEELGIERRIRNENVEKRDKEAFGRFEEKTFRPQDSDETRKFLFETKKIRKDPKSLRSKFRRLRIKDELKTRKHIDGYIGRMKTWMDGVHKWEEEQMKSEDYLLFRDSMEKFFPEMKVERESRERWNRSENKKQPEGDKMKQQELDAIRLKNDHADKMDRSSAIPPALLTAEQRKKDVFFERPNAIVSDMATVQLAMFAEQKAKWTDADKKLFQLRLQENGKNWFAISKFFEGKTTSDCILHYYLTKRMGNYKALIGKRKRGGRAVAKYKVPGMPNEEDLALFRQVPLTARLDLSCFLCCDPIDPVNNPGGKLHESAFETFALDLNMTHYVCMRCKQEAIKLKEAGRCPVANCVTAKRRMKPTKNLPPALKSCDATQRAFLYEEMQVPRAAIKFCANCNKLFTKKVDQLLNGELGKEYEKFALEKPWTSVETEKLGRLINEFGVRNWRAIAERMVSKTAAECQSQYEVLNGVTISRKEETARDESNETRKGDEEMPEEGEEKTYEEDSEEKMDEKDDVSVATDQSEELLGPMDYEEEKEEDDSKSMSSVSQTTISKEVVSNKTAVSAANSLQSPFGELSSALPVVAATSEAATVRGAGGSITAGTALTRTSQDGLVTVPIDKTARPSTSQTQDRVAEASEPRPNMMDCANGQMGQLMILLQQNPHLLLSVAGATLIQQISEQLAAVDRSNARVEHGEARRVEPPQAHQDGNKNKANTQLRGFMDMVPGVSATEQATQAMREGFAMEAMRRAAPSPNTEIKKLREENEQTGMEIAKCQQELATIKGKQEETMKAIRNAENQMARTFAQNTEGMEARKQCARLQDEKKKLDQVKMVVEGRLCDFENTFKLQKSRLDEKENAIRLTQKQAEAAHAKEMAVQMELQAAKQAAQAQKSVIGIRQPDHRHAQVQYPSFAMPHLPTFVNQQSINNSHHHHPTHQQQQQQHHRRAHEPEHAPVEQKTKRKSGIEAISGLAAATPIRHQQLAAPQRRAQSPAATPPQQPSPVATPHRPIPQGRSILAGTGLAPNAGGLLLPTTSAPTQPSPLAFIPSASNFSPFTSSRSSTPSSVVQQPVSLAAPQPQRGTPFGVSPASTPKSEDAIGAPPAKRPNLSAFSPRINDVPAQSSSNVTPASSAKSLFSLFKPPDNRPVVTSHAPLLPSQMLAQAQASMAQQQQQPSTSSFASFLPFMPATSSSLPSAYVAAPQPVDDVYSDLSSDEDEQPARPSRSSTSSVAPAQRMFSFLDLPDNDRSAGPSIPPPPPPPLAPPTSTSFPTSSSSIPNGLLAMIPPSSESQELAYEDLSDDD